MSVIESFHSLIKREWLDRFKIEDYDHAYRLVFEYIETFYKKKSTKKGLPCSKEILPSSIGNLTVFVED